MNDLYDPQPFTPGAVPLLPRVTTRSAVDRTGRTRRIRECLEDGRRLTVRQIASRLCIKTRQVHQIVCKGQVWLGRERANEDAEYVYFLA